jgi:predicted transcriptional regulator of viral defense system
MKIDELIRLAGDVPVINSELLKTGLIDIKSLEVQLSRWVKAGKLVQLRRSLYLLAEPYRKNVVDQLYLASVIESPSYVSLEKALEYYGLIPEAVSEYTCLTTKRPNIFRTQVGTFSYQHIKPELFWGYRTVKMGKCSAFVASSEKALLDFFYFHKGNVSMEYLEEMRFQNTEVINLKKLKQYAKKFGKSKVEKAAGLLTQFLSATKQKRTQL